MYYINDKIAITSSTGRNPYWNAYKTLSEQQNLLIAGTTGSGKSTVLHGIIHAICACRTACSAELWLADPKRVDLIEWLDMGTPQLGRYANTTEEIKTMISDLVRVMESRFRWMEDHRVKQYPGKTIYLVVDELGDLLINDHKKTFLHSLTRLLQLARAASIRIIACTQSPSRITIPAQLAVNYTAKLALRCATAIESRQVLNAAGAENLPRYGKGICLTPDYGMVTVDLPLQDMEDTKRMIAEAIKDTEYR